jgi:hypothetical protein
VRLRQSHVGRRQEGHVRIVQTCSLVLMEVQRKRQYSADGR